MSEKYYTITDINKYIKGKIDNDETLKSIYIKGEISNFKRHSRGHCYLTLKDETSKISAVMFSFNATKLLFEPKDGDSVLIKGKISVYEPSGNYQVYIEEMKLDGVGDLYVQFERLKQTLAKEGLFSSLHKKKIPTFPKKIGIITAPTGAAVRDIITTINRRYPLATTLLFPSLVQGTGAKENIVKCIKQANNTDIDVIILGRGGGSIEDLWAFNEEIVAREIYASNIPIISAVGHEIDFTISDFVADLRAPTPTAAAELAVPNKPDVIKGLNNLKDRINDNIKALILNKREKLNRFENNYILNNPLTIYEIKEQKLDNMIEKINYVINNKVNTKNNELNTITNKISSFDPLHLCKINKEKLNNYEEKIKNSFTNVFNNKKNTFKFITTKLELLNPISVLNKGYSITMKDSKVIKDANTLRKNDNIKIKFKTGEIKAEVKEIF